ncbi:Uncharacterised protein [Vibrio cholerae]|nr:Uncharacterised protein [Vibrio cholerae]CSA90558.1 Uncharacterised protein [Vibrio cholerae]CSB23888.1 Uncharacterised protein [Vibrio cholerae]CSC53725.1 Uncharacterised protein [Vibrio cholerae]CSC68483.1 Uncharacterised protein [Vibrio cholerae]
MKTKRLIWVFSLIFASGGNCLAHVLIGRSDQRWKEAGTARFKVSFVHGIDGFRCDFIIEHHTTTAIQL